MVNRNLLCALAAVAVLLIIIALPLPPPVTTAGGTALALSRPGKASLAVLAMAVTLWITEALPFPVTGLIALVALGIAKAGDFPTLVKEGFTVLTYTSDDPIMACKLEDAGAAVVMPLGSPIGSGQGILNPINMHLILQNVKVPVIIDAGVGTASDVAIAMELGAEGVLLNTGIALAKDPVLMASAMKHACIAGREAFLAGRIPKKEFGSPSSPVEGLATG